MIRNLKKQTNIQHDKIVELQGDKDLLYKQLCDMETMALSFKNDVKKNKEEAHLAAAQIVLREKDLDINNLQYFDS